MTIQHILASVFSYSLSLLALLIAASLLRNKYRDGLSTIPGPPVAAYTKFWRLYDVWKGQPQWTSIALHRQYGPLVRIAPNVVSVADADEIQKIYNTKGDFTKTGFYPIQSIIYDKTAQMNLFSTRDEAEHREQRKKLANTYSLESLLKMEPAVDACNEVFLNKVGEYADRGDAVDLGAWLHYYALDVVSALTFSTRLSFLEHGGDVDGIMQASAVIMLYATVIGQIPEAHPFLLGNPLLPLLIPQMESRNPVLVFVLEAINSRTTGVGNGELELEAGHDGDDMLSKWIAVEPLDPVKMSKRDLVVHSSANVFAGADTTATALRAIVYFLVKNPTKMEKLQREIDDASKTGKIGEPISDKEARGSLPYLNAVIKEAMRLHPSIGLMLERHVPAGGATICGRHIPGGTIVGINAWVLQHDREVFADPEAFEPERWLEGAVDKDQLLEMEKHTFVFGAGSRGCIGRNISMIEMRKVIPQLLREFDVSIEGDKEWDVRNVWFTQQRMPLCLLTRRIAK